MNVRIAQPLFNPHMLALHGITMTDSDASRLLMTGVLDVQEYRYIFFGVLVPGIMRQTFEEALVMTGLLVIFQQAIL